MKIRKPVCESLRQQILHLAAHGYGSRKIVERLDVSRSLVRWVLAEASTEELKISASAGSKLEPFLQIIREKVLKELTTTRILREIKDLGYLGSRTILGELVAKIRADNGLNRRPVAKRRFETAPGHEMQLDWSPYRVPINGKQVKIHVLGVISGYSRKLFFAAFRNERQGTLLEGLSMALEYYEGCALRLVVDNMTTAVLGRRDKGQIIWNQAFMDFSKHYGFTPVACAVRDPDRKGKQEKSFRLLEDDFIRGSSFASWDDLSRRLQAWLDKTPGVGNNRIHGTTGKVPNEEHLFEKSLFIRLPHERFRSYTEELRAADQDATISIAGIRYTIPPAYACRNVVVRLYAEHFEVLDKHNAMIFVSKYLDTTISPAKLVINQLHQANIARKPRGNEGSWGQHKDFIRRFPELSELADGIKVRFKSLAPIHLNALVRLTGQYGDKAVIEAGRHAVLHKRFSADSIKSILEQHCPEKPEQLVLPLNGLGGVIVGDVEESDLEEFAVLDNYESEDEEE